jgi:hypothetical protein
MPTNAAATGFWTAQNRNNARQGRALIQALFGNNDATPMNGTRSGVVTTTGLTSLSDLLVFNVSGLSMSVAPGTGIAHRSGQGPYAGWLLSTATITCDPAPATNPRNDIVVLRMYDSASGDTVPGTGPCQVEIITGTPGAVPVDPISVNSIGVYTSFPTSGGGVGIPLARAQVSTGGVITLTDLRRSTGIPGAVRVLLPGDSDTAGRVGDLRYTSSSDLLEIKRSDGNWYTIQTGTTGIIGAIVGDSGAITTDASTAWTSATKVLTNVVCSFTGVAGAKYEVIANVTWTCATASNQDAIGIAWKAGTLAATDALAGVVGPRTHPDGTGYNTTTIYGTLTAAVSGTHNVGVVGWKPTGNTGSSLLRANGTWAINRITVKRVG